MDPSLPTQTNNAVTPKSRNNTFLTLASILVACVIIVIVLVLYVVNLGFKKSNKTSVPTTDTSQPAGKRPYKYAQKTAIPKTVICAEFKDLRRALLDIDTACVLDLSGQNLSSLPPEIKKLTKLAQINLSKNNFTEFPPLLYEFKNLSVIDLSNNNISVFPEKVWQMEGLTSILLSNNNISSLPLPKQFTTVKTLWIDGNKVPHSSIAELKKTAPNIEVKE